MSIKEYTHNLKLPYIRENYDLMVEEAKHINMSYEEFLEKLLHYEYELRKSNGVQTKIRQAKFPYKQYLEDFEKEGYPIPIQKTFEELETLDFIDKKENVILIGTPGAGKTFYSIALGIKACMAQKRVLFTSVPNLMIEIKEKMSNNQLTSYKKKFQKYDLVILDELGYISFDKVGSEILFNLLSNRNNIGSTIITTNLTFDRWEEIFKDPILTGAMVDRLTHKSYILDMQVESHRMKETIKWLQEQK